MKIPTGLDGVVFTLTILGYRASAIAIVDKKETNYLGWYGQSSLSFFCSQKQLEYLGALVKAESNSQPEPRVSLTFGEPNSPIGTLKDCQFRHLSLEERERYQAGYGNPQDYILTQNRYDHLDGHIIAIRTKCAVNLPD